MVWAMESILLFMSFVLFRIIIHCVKSYAVPRFRLAWVFLMLATMIFCAFPLILINKGVVENSPINIILAGLSLFYFPIVVGRGPGANEPGGNW